jgi:hypothetical protein
MELIARGVIAFIVAFVMPVFLFSSVHAIFMGGKVDIADFFKCCSKVTSLCLKLVLDLCEVLTEILVGFVPKDYAAFRPVIKKFVPKILQLAICTLVLLVLGCRHW